MNGRIARKLYLFFIPRVFRYYTRTISRVFFTALLFCQFVIRGQGWVSNPENITSSIPLLAAKRNNVSSSPSCKSRAMSLQGIPWVYRISHEISPLKLKNKLCFETKIQAKFRLKVNILQTVTVYFLVSNMFLRFFTNCQIFNSLQAKSNFVGHKIV